MIPAAVTLPQAKLHEWLTLALARAGRTAQTITFHYDAGGGSPTDRGTGLSASVTIDLDGQEATLPYDQEKLTALLTQEIKARGYNLVDDGFYRPIVFSCDRGFGANDRGTGASAKFSVELPDRLVD